MVTLAWPLVLVALLLAVVVVAVLARRRRPTQARWVARTADLLAVPEIRRALRRAGLWRAVALVSLVAALVSAGMLAARPVDREVQSDRLGTRDIVLCLDVSGSMLPFDAAIVESFTALVDEFSGERVALSIFDSTSRTVFPLTDDYTLVLEELAEAQLALDYDLDSFDVDDEESWEGLDRLTRFVAGTYAVPDQASLIGDGLASCALLLDESDTERSRSIILATDNDVWGEPIYTLPQAVDLVAARDVGLFGLYGGDEELRESPQNLEYAQAMTQAAERPEAPGGGYWFAEDPEAIAAIIDDVTSQQEVALDAEPQVLLTDRPQPWVTVLLAALAVLLLARWRSRA